MPMSPRKRNETILMAILAIVSVVPLRFFVESRSWFLAEMGMLIALLAVAEVVKTFGSPGNAKPKLLTSSAITLLALTPVLFAVLARAFGSPIAFEMSALTTFGSTSLAIALSATSDRTRAMSLVISGFLVLFTTSISDDPRAVWLAIAWMTVCVWHLVANHWERLDLCLPDSVRPTIGVRPASVMFAVVLCIVGGLVVRDRFSQSNRLAFGFMPSSGGSKWSDPAARSGIGTGDAAIAAKDHAESFGAVESEIFLESTESTLFDMFNDTIGEPKKKNKWERRQAMNNDNFIPSHEQASKSEKGGSSFSTDRMPPKKHHHFDDAVEAAVVQWDGPTGIRLAMERFDTFDGVDWTNTANLADATLQRTEIDDAVWFFDRRLQSAVFENSDAVQVNLLKVLRLDTTRLPAPMMTAGLHIKDVDRQDFFGIDDDGSLFMPGREKVPPLTVAHLASLCVMEDELIDGAADYEGLKSIIQDLRTNFTLDRNSSTNTDDPVAEFLRTRRGGDHLFATVAALKAREIGFQSRIVTGFYVRPNSFDIAAGHSNVTPDDVHVWAEIRLEDGRWFEVEPTPGYREPVYTPSMWLVAKRFAAEHWTHGLAIAGVFAFLFFTRLIWIEWLLSLGWSLSWPLGRQRQLRIAMGIVETRAKLIGQQRPAGTPQRDWMESLVASDIHLRDRVREFCNDADKSIFGGSGTIDRDRLSGVVRGLNSRQMKQVVNGAKA
ncbi:Transglutaminase-like superfamily protein [Rubripirellula obstinata]|uniref:Transglutaminase-like superfamily protein n=1 Tax=Rubripirellula obstinata TaxID=406547 RepID=A0A5B1CLG1_9BACT|nr:Transglutaminase-like superfamily protein [Rubripirellula obstinata]